jgi:hypothetical protein
MNKLKILVALVALSVSLGPGPVLADDLGVRGAATTPPLIEKVLSHYPWYFDGRGDARDFPTNGFFPGDFAADPAAAAFGAAGIFGSTPAHASRNYPSQAIVVSQHDQTHCARRHHSYDRASGTFPRSDGAYHRC